MTDPTCPYWVSPVPGWVIDSYRGISLPHTPMVRKRGLCPVNMYANSQQLPDDDP